MREASGTILTSVSVRGSGCIEETAWDSLDTSSDSGLQRGL